MQSSNDCATHSSQVYLISDALKQQKFEQTVTETT